jgi:hypothetical protein
MGTYLVLGTRFCKKYTFLKFRGKCLFELELKEIRKKERKTEGKTERETKRKIERKIERNHQKVTLTPFLFIQSFTLISFFRLFILSLSLSFVCSFCLSLFLSFVHSLSVSVCLSLSLSLRFLRFLRKKKVKIHLCRTFLF